MKKCKQCRKKSTFKNKNHLLCIKCKDINRLFKFRKLKRRLVKEYGGKCKCCNENRIEFLTIDHIYGGGRQERIKLAREKEAYGTCGFYLWLIRNKCPKDKYRLLCMNCNFAKRFGKPCPHEKRYKEWAGNIDKLGQVRIKQTKRYYGRLGKPPGPLYNGKN